MLHFIRVEPQPPEGYRSMVSDCDPSGAWWFSNMPRISGPVPLGEFSKWQHVYPKSPYKVGELFPVREDFDLGRGDRLEPVMAIYHDEKEPAYILHPNMPERARHWRLLWKACKAAEMPDWAVRTKLPVRSITAVRAGEVSNDASQAAGFTGHYSPAYVSGGEIVGPDGAEPREELVSHFGGPGVWLWRVSTATKGE